jgi:hypothetical protein
VRLYWKIKQKWWGWSVAQVPELLPSKCKTLSSTPSTAKTKQSPLKKKDKRAYKHKMIKAPYHLSKLRALLNWDTSLVSALYLLVLYLEHWFLNSVLTWMQN